MAIGVDGCRFGWVAVYVDGAHLGYGLFRGFQQLLTTHRAASTVLVDIPIGLPWSACPSRPCDVLARRLLGRRRASSVFPAPSRPACHAQNLAEARARNLTEVKRSLSAQAWGICEKVAEVDTLLLANAEERRRVREVHPELCFWALNGGHPMLYAKSTRQGRDERLAVLNGVDARCGDLLERVLREQRRKDVQPDDVLDALSALFTASASQLAPVALRGDPTHDLHGLPMEMLHASLG